MSATYKGVKHTGSRTLGPLNNPKPSLTNWKSGLQFRQHGQVNSHNMATGPSRYTKRSSFVDPKRKGTFQENVNIGEAPSLISVISAKPEIKQKATEEMVERAKKKDEQLRRKGRVVVKKPPPNIIRNAWTSVLSDDPDNPLSPSLRKARMKSPWGSKPPVGSIKPDWSSAYADIVSPTSGTHKFVAKQDLAIENKLHSPKKKARSPPRAYPIPSLPLDDDDDEEEHPQKEASPVKPVLVLDEEESNRDFDDEEEEESESREVVRAVTPPLDPSSYNLDGFVDVSSDQESKGSPTGEVTPMGEKPKVKTQLILEFALPNDDGDENDEDGLQVPVDVQSFDDLSSVGSWPSIASKDSYDTKLNKMMQRWMDIHGVEDEESRTSYDNDVDLEDNVLDHIVLAVPDLDVAMDQFEEMAGIRPTPVGPLQGLGAKTAHVGLDGNRYLELLAPDFDNPGPLGEELAQLEKGTMTPYYYSIRSSEVSRLIEGYIYDVLGWDPDHIAMVQALPDKSIRQWDILTMYGHDVGGVAPCYIKWKDPAHHPTATIALKAALTTCIVQAPQGHNVHKLIAGVGGLDVRYGEPLLEVTFSSPKGSHTFSSRNPKGLVFPGYEIGQQNISQTPDDVGVSGANEHCDLGSDSESSAT